MKFWLVALSLITTFNSHAYIIISDLDDTIKISNSGSTVAGGVNGVFSTKVFAGSSEYLKGTELDRAGMYIVSASPKMLMGKVEKLLDTHDIAVDGITLRGNLLQDKFKYKKAAINKILAKHPQEQVIFLGDDVGLDPEVYEYFRITKTSRVLAVYIRPIENRAFAGVQLKVFSFMDIAFHEVLAGRLALQTALAVGDSLQVAPMDLVIPKFAYCPRQLDELSSEAPSVVAMVNERITEECRARHSGNVKVE